MKVGRRHKWREVILLCLQPQPLPSSSKLELPGGCSAQCTPLFMASESEWQYYGTDYNSALQYIADKY